MILNLVQNMHALFFVIVLFIRLLFQTKYMASNGEMADFRGCVLGPMHYQSRTANRFFTNKIRPPPFLDRFFKKPIL